MQKNNDIPWGLLMISALLLVLWLTGGKDFAKNLLYPQAQYQMAPTITPIYQPAPADPTQNGPGGDYFNYVKTAVPTEMRERISLPQLFSLDLVLLNQYFDQSTYLQANTEVAIVSAQRARAAETYAAMAWENNWWTQALGIDGEIVSGSELATITSADVFLIVGTTPGHVLANIRDIEVIGQAVTVTAEIEMTGLYLGLNVSEETSRPQVESMAVSTPHPLMEWLLFSGQIPTESELNNHGVRTATREAIWLLLHQDADRLWQEFSTSISHSNGGTSGYDLLAPFVRQAFCLKLDSYQQQLQAEGKNLDIQSCDANVIINVVLIPRLPQGPNGQVGVEFMKMARSGAYVQMPDTTIP